MNSHYNNLEMNKIRQANLSDIPALKELYQNTVLTVNRKDYTAEEVKDWASCGSRCCTLGRASQRATLCSG